MGKYLDMLDNGKDARVIILDMEQQCEDWENTYDSLIKLIIASDDDKLKEQAIELLDSYDK